MNTYLVTGPTPVFDTEPGGTFEHAFTAAEEADLLDNGRLEIVPREYRVIGTSRVFETKPGDKFRAALRMHQEAALFEGGHIERVPDKPAVKKAATPKET